MIGNPPSPCCCCWPGSNVIRGKGTSRAYVTCLAAAGPLPGVLSCGYLAFTRPAVLDGARWWVTEHLARLTGGDRRKELPFSHRTGRVVATSPNHEASEKQVAILRRMAAPQDQIRSPMASSPMRAGQHESQRALGGREVDDGGADLEPAVTVQLIAKTGTLSISGLGNEPDELAGPADRNRTPSAVPAETTHSHAQPDAATTDDRREDASGTDSAVTTDVLSASCSWTTETISRTGTQADEMDAADGSAVVAERNPSSLSDLPNELLLHILGYLEVCDLLAISRVRQLLPLCFVL